jgi:hypothetical protein
LHHSEKTTESCRGGETRTPGLYVPNVARYQLRHTPMIKITTCKNIKIFAGTLKWRKNSFGTMILFFADEGLRKQ